MREENDGRATQKDSVRGQRCNTGGEESQQTHTDIHILITPTACEYTYTTPMCCVCVRA